MGAAMRRCRGPYGAPAGRDGDVAGRAAATRLMPAAGGLSGAQGCTPCPVMGESRRRATEDGPGFGHYLAQSRRSPCFARGWNGRISRGIVRSGERQQSLDRPTTTPGSGLGPPGQRRDPAHALWRIAMDDPRPRRAPRSAWRGASNMVIHHNHYVPWQGDGVHCACGWTGAVSARDPGCAAPPLVDLDEAQLPRKRSTPGLADVIKAAAPSALSAATRERERGEHRLGLARPHTRRPPRQGPGSSPLRLP